MPKPVFSKSTLLDQLYAKEGKAISRLHIANGPLAEWRGATNARLAIVTSVYLANSEPFQFLLQTIKEVGLTATDVYLTTSTKNFLLRKLDGFTDDVIDTRSVKRAEVDALHPFLIEELSIVAPNLILCMGTNSAKVLLGSLQFNAHNERGIATYQEGLPAPVLFTYSPSYAILTGSNSRNARAFKEDVSQAASLSYHTDL